MPNLKQSIFLFYGENTYSSAQKLRFWQSEFAKKYGKDAIEITDWKNINTSEFATNIEAIPFLSEKRMIIVKDFLSNTKTEEQKQIADHLDKAVSECVIIFYENEAPDKRSSLFKKIAKIGQLEEFEAMHPKDIAKWIIEKAKKEGIKIKLEIAEYISEYCGPDLWTISNELEKLKLFANNGEITKKMVDDLCVPSLTSSIFKLTDSISQKKTKDSLKTFKILKESGEELSRIFYMIARHFRILIQVHEMINQGEKQFSITKKLKQHPFVIQKTAEQSKNFTREKLENIHKKLLEIDRQTKTGIIKSYQTDYREFELAVEQLIIDCCN